MYLFRIYFYAVVDYGGLLIYLHIIIKATILNIVIILIVLFLIDLKMCQNN